MGYMGYQADEYPGITKIEKKEIVEIHVTGKCPMCETPFDVTLRSVNSNNFLEYKCPCGYFTYYGDMDRVTEDDHGTPKEVWMERLHQNVARSPKS